MINPGTPITILPTTFHRPPFSRLPPWHNQGTVRRVIGRENGRVLLEVELDGACWVVWDYEISGDANTTHRVSLDRGNGG